MELVENFIGVLERQHKLLEQLSNNQTASGSLVNKNIIKSPNSTLDSEVNRSKLGSNEKSRVKDASSIFISKFFEEQKRQKKDTAEKTLVSKLKKPVLKQASIDSSSGLKQESGGWLSKLLGLLGLGALAKFLKPQVLKEFFKKGITKLVGFFKNIISSIWNSIKGFFSKIWRGIKGFVNAIKNSKFVKRLGNIISKAWQGIKNVFSFIKRKIVRIFKLVGTTISGLWGRITNSKAYKAFTGIIDSALSAIKGFFKAIAGKILSVVKAATAGISSLIPGGIKSAASGVGQAAKTVAKKSKGVLGKLVDKAKSVVTTAGRGIVRGATAVGSGISKGASAVGGASVDAAKSLVANSVKGVVKSSGGMFKLMGKLTAKGAARIPIIGAAIESVLANMDINAMKKKGLPEDQLQSQAGRRVVTGVTGTIGAAGGAALAGALGSIVPFAGTALGMIMGSYTGDAVGRFLGGLLSDHVFSPKYVKSIGAFVTGTTPPREEMQDFIIKGNKVYPFSNRDEIMGLKSGGAINEFLQGGGMQDQAIKTLTKVNLLSIEYLKAIATNTALMVNNLKGNSSGGGPVIVQSSQQSQPQSKNMVNMPNNRSGYLSSPYALA